MSLFNKGGLVDALAYGTLNEILGLGNSTDGMSRPNRYEVTLLPPTGTAGTANTGSGGGAGTQNSGNGGSGIVIVRYLVTGL